MGKLDFNRYCFTEVFAHPIHIRYWMIYSNPA